MRRFAVFFVTSVLAGCSAGGAERARPPAVAAATPVPANPEPSGEPRDWRRPRYVPVREAVDRLARHVDVPVVLPRHGVFLRSYRGWLADPKHLSWSRRGDETVGSLHLISRRDYLWISYGYAVPDGCGDRSSAVPTEVLGEPALLWHHSGDHSTIFWPVRPHGRIGRFGLSGSFLGHEIHRLAESMETQIRAAPRHDPGC
ncbi:MAG TPA: hypothetical protein VEV43_15180 [Actinomycetota bacterium]|nr:hypothetical protein [Actinomycetota bacterium]